MDDKGNIQSMEYFKEQFGDSIKTKLEQGAIVPIPSDQEKMVRSMTWKERMNWLDVQRKLRHGVSLTLDEWVDASRLSRLRQEFRVHVSQYVHDEADIDSLVRLILISLRQEMETSSR